MCMVCKHEDQMCMLFKHEDQSFTPKSKNQAGVVVRLQFQPYEGRDRACLGQSNWTS